MKLLSRTWRFFLCFGLVLFFRSNFAMADLLSLSSPYEVAEKDCSEIDLEPYMPPYRDQGDLGWCTLQPLADMLGYAYREQLQGQDVSVMYFGFQTEITKDNIPLLGGINLPIRERILQEAQKDGICTSSNFEDLFGDQDPSWLKERIRLWANLKYAYDNNLKQFHEDFDKLQDPILVKLGKSEVMHLFNQTTLKTVWDALAKGICQKRVYISPNDRSNPVIEDKRGSLVKELNKQLSRYNPVALDLNLKGVFINLGEEGGHSMTVIARKWDKVKGCKYFLRNSWGSDSGCGKYSDEYQKECHNGSIWMSAKRIYENGDEILYIPRKSSLPPAALLKEDPLVAHWIVAPFNQILVVDEQKKLKWRQFLGREPVVNGAQEASLPKKFKWSQDGKWALLGPVGEVYKIFPGSITGTLYLIDGNGKLHWYRWLGQEKDGKFYLGDVPRHMGPDPLQLPKELLWNGWKHYSDFAAEKKGIIYAAEPQGRIYKYQHLGYQEGISWWKNRAQRQLAAVLPPNTRLLAVEDGKIYGLDSLNKVQYCAMKQGVCKHWTYAGITFELGEKPNWGVQDSVLPGQYNFFSIDGDHNLILRVYAKDIKAAKPFRLLVPPVKISGSGWSLKERDEIIIDKQ